MTLRIIKKVKKVRMIRYPLTKKETALVKSLEAIFFASLGLILSLDKRTANDPNTQKNIVLAAKKWKRRIYEHCSKFDIEASQRLRATSKTYNGKRFRMKRDDK